MSSPALAVPTPAQKEINRLPASTAASTTEPVRLDTAIEPSAQNDIAQLAYALWQKRGCPDGSAEIDWLEAEAQLRR